MKNKKKSLIILISMVTLVILFIAILYVNLKSFTVKKVLIKEQEVYIMGTFHTDHFKKYANYSMAEMINAIDNINPDVIFIEAREMYFNEYGVVDGPVDMCVVYSYCSENNIPVEMIDYWEITNDSKTNTTTDDRDNHIHDNIMKKIDGDKNKRVLVVCGFGHLNAQTKRLVDAGGQKQHISHTSDLFKGDNEEFIYPSMSYDVWEERVNFYAHVVPKLVQQNDDLSEETKAKWPEDVNNSFYDSQMKYGELFKENKLYID